VNPKKDKERAKYFGIGRPYKKGMFIACIICGTKYRCGKSYIVYQNINSTLESIIERREEVFEKPCKKCFSNIVIQISNGILISIKSDRSDMLGYAYTDGQIINTVRN